VIFGSNSLSRSLDIVDNRLIGLYDDTSLGFLPGKWKYSKQTFFHSVTVIKPQNTSVCPVYGAKQVLLVAGFLAYF